MPTALLAGAFGQRNPGDEALLDAFVAALRRVGRRRDDVARRRGAAARRRPTACRPAIPSRVARRVAARDAVVFAGGTIFKELSPATGRPPLDLLQKGLAMAYGAKALGKPLAMVGVGAAPIAAARGRLLARRLVRQADLLVLRDEESADVLAEAGAPAPFRIGADAGVDAAVRAASSAPAHGERVIVALSHEAGDGELCDDLAAALVPVLAAGHTGRAAAVAGRRARAPRRPRPRARGARSSSAARPSCCSRPPTCTRRGRRSPAPGSSSACASTRCVAAAAAGTPFLAYAHEPKLAARGAPPRASPR